MSHICFSQNVSKDLASQISNTSGIPLTNNLGEYLGVTSIHGCLTNDMFDAAIEIVQGRLEDWKTKFLSLAGRQTLVKSILGAIPLYPMQTTLILKVFAIIWKN